LAIAVSMVIFPEPRQSRLKLCQMAPFLSPHNIFAMLPSVAAKSAVHTIVRSRSQ
jgi:hypothetical protein